MTPARRGKPVEPPVDSAETAFPASAATPGQKESRTARAAFLEQRAQCPWWQDYLELRLEGWDWRKAAYIAWKASPAKGRWPKTKAELATILGLASDRVIRKWVEKEPAIDERVAKMQIEPLMEHRADVIQHLVDLASTGSERYAFQYQKIFLTMTNDLGAKKDKPVSGAAREGDNPTQHMTDDELEQQIKNLQMTAGVEVEDDESDDSDD